VNLSRPATALLGVICEASASTNIGGVHSASAAELQQAIAPLYPRLDAGGTALIADDLVQLGVASHFVYLHRRRYYITDKGRDYLEAHQ
jgi:hypothetical protein